MSAVKFDHEDYRCSFNLDMGFLRTSKKNFYNRFYSEKWEEINSLKLDWDPERDLLIEFNLIEVNDDETHQVISQ